MWCCLCVAYRELEGEKTINVQQQTKQGGKRNRTPTITKQNKTKTNKQTNKKRRFCVPIRVLYIYIRAKLLRLHYFSDLVSVRFACVATLKDGAGNGNRNTFTDISIVSSRQFFCSSEKGGGQRGKRGKGEGEESERVSQREREREIVGWLLA